MNFKIDVPGGETGTTDVLQSILFYAEKFSCKKERVDTFSFIRVFEGDISNANEEVFLANLDFNIATKKLTLKLVVENKIDIWENGVHINDVLEIVYTEDEYINNVLEKYWEKIIDKTLKSDNLPF